MNNHKRIILIPGIIIYYVIFTYALWWMSLTGTVLIIIFAYLLWEEKGLGKIGLKIPLKEIFISILIFVAVAIGTYWLINKITIEKEVLFIPFFKEIYWYKNITKTIGQTINEEIVLGALLLGYIKYLFKKLNPVIISFAVALIFCLFHFSFFYFRISVFTNFGVLFLPCLLSILFVGILRNNCILSSGHIGYAWAIHLGWNLIFMDSVFYQNNITINEPNLFNLILGNESVVIAAFVVMLLSFSLYRIYKQTNVIIQS